VHYLNKECWEDLLDGIFVVELLENLTKVSPRPADISVMIKRILFLKESAVKAGYDLTKLINSISA